MIVEPEPGPLWRLEVSTPAHAVPAFETALEGICVAVSSFGDDDIPWRVEGYTDRKPDEEQINEGLALAAAAAGVEAPTLSVEFLTPRDWLAENLASFEPLRIGRFFIYPSHFADPPPPGTLAMKIDAGTAFGSGEHPTTATCIQAISNLARSHPCRRILDLGCGSGLLAFAAAKLWPTRVTAVDIDPEAVRVTHRNARENGLHPRIQCLESAGFRNRRIAREGPFDLIMANVLARPLTQMAADTARALAPNGIAILSGLLVRDAAWVAAKHKAHGLVFQRQYVSNDWATLVMRKRVRG